MDYVLGPMLERMGIESLYPPQEEAIPHVMEGRSVLLSVPTAAGKSLVAYAALLNGLRSGKKGLYIVPLRALASEKFEDLRKALPEYKVGLSTGDLTTDDRALKDNDVVVVTSEKADALLRHGNEFFDDVGVCVADEVHLITDPRRGPTLEIVLAMMKRRGTQIVALSATVGNAMEIALWLDATLVTSDWRPVRLREGVFTKGVLEFIDGETRKPGPSWEDLVGETVKEGGQVLVFTRSRKAAEKNATSFGATLGIDGPKIEPDEDWGEIGRSLTAALKGGAGFHHAGLGRDMRRIVENAFRDGGVKVLFATPTLAAGINLPARRVLILTTRRFERGVGMTDIPVLEIRQMMGRAGRPGLDPHGEAVIIANNDRGARKAVDAYILGEVEPITSKLLDPRAMRVHVLAAIATGECRSEEDIDDFLSHTFYAHTTDLWTMESALDHTLEMLEEGGFIDIEDGIRPTPLGVVTSRVYVDPASAVLFRQAIGVMPEGEFHHLMAISSCPDMYRLSARKDTEDIDRFTEGTEWLVPLVPAEDHDDARRTSAVLKAWIDEMPEVQISETFGIGPGDLHNLRETAAWLGGAYAEIASLEDIEKGQGAREVSKRLADGVKTELLPLMRVPGIGRRRGRVLFGAGYRDLQAIGEAQIADLEGLPHMGPATARTAIEWSRRNWRRNRHFIQ